MRSVTAGSVPAVTDGGDGPTCGAHAGLQARGQGASTLHGAGWAAMLGTVLYGIISVAFTVWFTVLIRERWSGDGPLRARAGRASYATYVLHPLALTAIMVLFASLALAPELKFLAVAVVAIPVCFLAGYAATRVPGMSKVLLLIFQGALDDHLGQLARQPALAGQAPPRFQQ